MLLQRQSPLPTRCSTWWRLTAVATASLLIGTSTLFVGVNRAEAQTAPDRERDQQIATLRAERDQLAARLKEMEIRLNQMEARMQTMRAESQAQEAERRLRMRAEEDQRRAADPNAARSQLQPIPEGARSAVQRRSELQREQALSERRAPATTIDADTGQPAATDTAAPAKPKDPNRATNHAGQGLNLDLITLANAYIEATGTQRLRAIQAERLKIRTGNNTASHDELETAQAELDMANRKARLFRSMAEAALRAAEAELQNTKNLIELGLMPTSSTHDAESKVTVLRQILSS